VHITDAARVELGYGAGFPQALCCSPSHLFVYERVPFAVHIHTWDGQHRQTVKLQGRDGDRIHAIQYIPQLRQLVAAIGPWNAVTDLLSTKVRLRLPS
jgi:hypothetical protein